MPQINYLDKKPYDNIHKWIKRHFGKANHCEQCGIKDLPTGYKRFFHWANLSGNYLHTRKDWKQLCSRCHSRFDVAVLTEEKVTEIRRLYMQKKINQYKLAEMFNINQSNISRIINNKRWVLV